MENKVRLKKTVFQNVHVCQLLLKPVFSVEMISIDTRQNILCIEFQKF